MAGIAPPDVAEQAPDGGDAAVGAGVGPEGPPAAADRGWRGDRGGGAGGSSPRPQRLTEAAGRLNLRIAGGGSHPFHAWTDRRVYPTDRFKHILEVYGYLAKQFTVFGQHVHIGCPHGDDALFLLHALNQHTVV